MPPKNRKKAVASSGAATQGRTGQRKTSAKITADSGDEFAHLIVEAEDRYISILFPVPYSVVFMLFYFLQC